MKTNKLFLICTALVSTGMIGLTPGAASARAVDTSFDANNFTTGAPIDNQYWPLSPGMIFVFTNESQDGCEAELFEVTNQQKSDFKPPYDTILATEIHDRSWLSEECDGNYSLIETTKDWYAQDKVGNIWYFGEETESYDNDQCPSISGTWVAGNDGAEPGVIMLADPKAGDSYQQELAAGAAEDMAKVLRLNAAVNTDAGAFESCLETKEWSPLEAGAIEHKFYCPDGGGLMLIQELKGKTLRTEYVGDTLPTGTYAPVGVCP